MHIRLLAIVCFILFVSSPLVVTATTIISNETTSVIPSFSIYEDTANQDGIYAVIEGRPFQLHKEATLSKGYTKSTYWLRFSLVNTSTQHVWYLQIDSPPLDYLEVYQYDGRVAKLIALDGDLLPFGQRDVALRNFVVPLAIPYGQEATFYVKVKTEGAMKVPLTIINQQQLTERVTTEYVGIGLFAGFMVVMVLYNAFLYVTTKERVYFYYVGFVLSVFFFQMTFVGLCYEYLWPNAPWWNNRAIVFFIGLSQWLAPQFILQLIGGKERFKWAHRLVTANMVLQWAMIAILLLYSYALALKIAVILTLVSDAIILYLVLLSYRHRSFAAKYLLLAWSIVVATSIIAALADSGMIVPTVMTDYGFPVATCLEVVLFAFAIAEQIKMTRQQLLAKERQFTEKLEETVMQRTSELEMTMASLQSARLQLMFENLSLNEEIEQTQREIIMMLADLVEQRSHETSNHVKRVAEYSYTLARYAGLSEDEAQLIRISAPLHDIGKIAIEDAILLKPGKLTEEEFEWMKQHTTIGYELLQRSPRQIMKTAAIIAHQHHERYDGTGYPQRLVGEDIHLYARIVALADVFDALSSDRVYKKAWPLADVKQLFSEERGRQFDPCLTDLFLAHFDEMVQIQRQYCDTMEVE